MARLPETVDSFDFWLESFLEFIEDVLSECSVFNPPSIAVGSQSSHSKALKKSPIVVSAV